MESQQASTKNSEIEQLLLEAEQQALIEQLLERFTQVEDPRREQGKRHNLAEMIFMSLCAVLSGANGWIAVEQFCESQKDWLKQYLKLAHGIPTHDTFERVFAVLRPKALEEMVMKWLGDAGYKRRDKVIAIDGKKVRGSLCKATEQSPLYLLHAFGTSTGVLLGQQEVDRKENEIVAIPRILAELGQLQGQTVTIDAMGCQKSVAEDITKRRGDFVLALRDNQPGVHKHVRQRFEFAERRGWTHTRSGESFGHYRDQSELEKDHGRLEQRQVDVLDASGDWFHDAHPGWKSVQSVIRVTSTRVVAGVESTEQRFYISSHEANAETDFQAIIRSHWAIENKLHWCLDTVFAEDRSKTTKNHGLRNLATFRRICLALLRSDTQTKAGLQSKRRMAAWSSDYRAKILHLF